MSVKITARGARIQNPQFPPAAGNALIQRLRTLPGLRYVLSPSLLTVGQNPLATRDARAGKPVYATLGRSPAVLADGGSAWNNRPVLDGVGVTNLNLGLYEWRKTQSFTCIFVAERPTGQMFLTRSNNNQLEWLIESGGSMRARTNGSAGASQLTHNVGSSAYGPTVYAFSFDGSDMTAALYVGSGDVPVAAGAFAVDGSVDGNLWIANSGAANPLLGKFADWLWFDVAYHKPTYSSFRLEAFAALKDWYGLA